MPAAGTVGFRFYLGGHMVVRQYNVNHTVVSFSFDILETTIRLFFTLFQRLLVQILVK
jgi:hypothetical protein